MQYRIDQYHIDNLSGYIIWKDYFSDSELSTMCYLPELYSPPQKGTVGNNPRIEPSTRDANITWINHDQASDWLYRKFGTLVSHVNHNHFMYHIEGFNPFQFSSYTKDQHYTWHMDMHTGTWEDKQRKFSATIMLDSCDSYEGGEFEICIHGNLNEIESLKPRRGDVIFFASWMPHRVCPVTDGERRSLVTWVNGNRFV